MKIKMLVFIILSIFLLTNAFADVTIVLKNPTKEEMVARVEWVNHDKGCRSVMGFIYCEWQVFVGMVRPVNKSIVVLDGGYSEKGLIYRILWTQGDGIWTQNYDVIHTHEFTVDNLNEILISDSTKMEIEHGKGKKNIR